jgi:hypothetical protein
MEGHQSALAEALELSTKALKIILGPTKLVTGTQLGRG